MYAFDPFQWGRGFMKTPAYLYPFDVLTLSYLEVVKGEEVLSYRLDLMRIVHYCYN